MVCVARDDRHRPTVLTPCPLLFDCSQNGQESDYQLVPSTLLEYSVGPILCCSLAPRVPLHWIFPRGLSYLIPGVLPRLPPTVNTWAVLPRSSLPNAFFSLSVLVATMAISNALSIFSDICYLTCFPGNPLNPFINAANSILFASWFITACHTAISLLRIVRWHYFRRWSKNISGLSPFSWVAFCTLVSLYWSVCLSLNRFINAVVNAAYVMSSALKSGCAE